MTFKVRQKYLIVVGLLCAFVLIKSCMAHVKITIRERFRWALRPSSKRIFSRQTTKRKFFGETRQKRFCLMTDAIKRPFLEHSHGPLEDNQ